MKPSSAISSANCKGSGKQKENELLFQKEYIGQKEVLNVMFYVDRRRWRRSIFCCWNLTRLPRAFVFSTKVSKALIRSWTRRISATFSKTSLYSSLVTYGVLLACCFEQTDVVPSKSPSASCHPSQQYISSPLLGRSFAFNNPASKTYTLIGGYSAYTIILHDSILVNCWIRGGIVGNTTSAQATPTRRATKMRNCPLHIFGSDRNFSCLESGES